MLRSIFVLIATTVLLGACASAPNSATSTPSRCDRSGEREERVACGVVTRHQR
jgi:uncharacterized lipoprotein YajG